MTGAPLELLLSLKSTFAILPSGATVVVEVATTLPPFLSVSLTVCASTTWMAIESM